MTYQKPISDLSVAVVIPVYKETRTALEEISLVQCLKILGKHRIFVAKPSSLDLSAWNEQYPQLEYVDFDDRYFADINGYNKLLVSPLFYRKFKGFEFMLIHQLDAFVFKDELEKWCHSGYDYIGAPSMESSSFDALQAGEKDAFKSGLRRRRVVLNGGLSLRRIPALLRFLKIHNIILPAWPGNEDMLFSLDSTRLKPLKFLLKLPGWDEALQFAFEKSPSASYEINGRKLPFGCHAWQRYDPGFWKDFIPSA